MQYSEQNCFDEVKGIISGMFSYISDDKITPKANMKYDLGFDDYDKTEIIMQFEYNYNVSVKNDKPLMMAITLGEFCNILHKARNAEPEQVIVPQTQKNTLLNRVRNLFIKQN